MIPQRDLLLFLLLFITYLFTYQVITMCTGASGNGTGNDSRRWSHVVVISQSAAELARMRTARRCHSTSGVAGPTSRQRNVCDAAQRTVHRHLLRGSVRKNTSGDK